jgi:uncharacterized protein (DUF433 family)
MSSSSKHISENDFIVVDPEIMDGLPTIGGTRIPVYIILEMIESGCSFGEIQREYPFLEEYQIRAAVHFAVERVSLT